MTLFVPNGDSRKQTAILLVGTADEFGIDQRAIKSVGNGFLISDELAAVLYAEDEQNSKPTKKASGNRAAKKNSKEE